MKKQAVFLALTVIFQVIISHSSAQSDTLELPFFEDWSTGSYETNGWIADSGWAINTNEGNPQPTAFFNARNYTEQYNKYLSSALIDATNIAEGEVFLKLDVKLRSNNPDNYGKLYIKIEFEGGNREIVESFANIYGSFDWQQTEINISQYSKGRRFKLFIQAIGDPNAVDDWSVDNIHIYRVCEAPKNFEVKVDTVGEDNYQLNFTWEMDEPDPGEWLHWDDGNHAGGVGACVNMTVAARWDSNQLFEYDGYKIVKMRAILNDDGLDSLIFKIWEGDSADVMIYKDTIHSFVVEEWIEHELESDLFIDSSKELWVGYSIRNSVAGMFPMGYDSGPAIAGFGDLIRDDCNSGNGESKDWTPLSELGIDNNWSIQVYIDEPTGKQILIDNNQGEKKEKQDHLVGYKLYHSINGGNYHYLEYIPWTPGDTTHSTDLVNDYKSHCYQLVSVWASIGDLCQSAPAISKENPDEDFVCVLLVGEGENTLEKSGHVKCYPNPFSHSTTFEYTLEEPGEVEVIIYNQMGEKVDEIRSNQQPGKQQIIWEPGVLLPGLYGFAICFDNRIEYGRLILIR